MKHLPLLLLGAVLATATQAQIVQPELPDTTDFQGWTTLKGQLRLGESWTVELKEQFRLKNDLATFDREFRQLTLGFSPQWGAVAEAQEMVLGARLILLNDDQGNKQGLERFFRWHADHNVKVEVGRWTVSSRIRYQERTAIQLAGDADAAAEGVKRTWRVKAGLAYDIKGWKLDPRCSLERFFVPVPEGWPSDGAWRARFGTDFKTGKRQRLKVVLQREWRGKYLPSGTGATLDDFRLYGDNQWALVASYRYRFKSRKAE